MGGCGRHRGSAVSARQVLPVVALFSKGPKLLRRPKSVTCHRPAPWVGKMRTQRLMALLTAPG